MSLPFCTMTSRSARLTLSEQQKSLLLIELIPELERNETRNRMTAYAYRDLRVVVEYQEQLIKIMTENEYRRLYPTRRMVKQIPNFSLKVA